jgi:hypothetical protein
VDERKKNALIKTVDIRLEGVRDATQRGRLALLIMIVAYSAILLVMWNAHFAWNRKIAFPTDMKVDKVDKYESSEQRDKPCFPDPEIKCPGHILSLDEYNRRNLAAQWLKSTDISIGLLGVTINSNDLDILGVSTLMMITTWLVFSLRRENRTIVALLRDINNETNFTKKERYSDEWDVANLAFQGIVNNLIFVSVTKDDFPLGGKSIFEESDAQESKKVSPLLVDSIVARLISIVRSLLPLALFIPPFAIVAIFYIDFHSLTLNSSMAPDFAKVPNSDDQILRWIWEGVGFILTLANCFASYVFEYRTQTALQVFGGKLKEMPTIEGLRKQSEVQ